MPIYREYSWSHRGRDFHHEKEWDESWMSDLEAMPHEVTDSERYGEYVDQDPYKYELAYFLGEIRCLGIEAFNFTSDRELLEFYLSFVQSLDYYRERGEYPRYPTETVIDGGGDCEDTAILMAFIAGMMRYECAFIQFSSDGFLGIGSWAHLDLGIAPKYDGEFHGTYWEKNGTKYYFVSCNGEGFRVGEYDDQWGDSASIYPV